MYNNNNLRIRPEYGGDEGSNMTFSHNLKGGVTLESVESPRFNEEKIRLSTKSSQQNNSKNFSELGTLPTESLLFNQQVGNNSKEIQGKIKEQGGNLSESLQRYKNIMNQIQQNDQQNSGDQYESSSEQNSEQKIPIKPSIYIERERKLDPKQNYQLPITSSNYSSKSSMQSSQYKSKQYGQNYNTQRLEDIEDIENYDSSNNEEFGVSEKLRRLREKDYFDDTENEQSFDLELNNRLKMMEVKKQLMSHTSASTSNYNSSTINKNKFNYNDSMDSSVSSSLAAQSYNQLEFSNSKVNLPQSNIIGNKPGVNLGSKNSNNLQNNSLYKELIEKKNPQSDNFSQQQQTNSIQKYWQDHVNQYQQQLNISGMSTQQNQIQQNHIQQQQHNLSIDDSSLHNQSNQSSILRTSRLEQSEQAIQQNNQQSILGINSRFQNSTLHSRYSFLEQDQSHNIANKSFDNSEKKNISRTIYNSSLNNPNVVARFIGQGQANSQSIHHNKSSSNINVSSILPENIIDSRPDYIPSGRINNNINNPYQNKNPTYVQEKTLQPQEKNLFNQQKNKFIQENNRLIQDKNIQQSENITDFKNNFLDDQSIIHKKGQSQEENDYQHNENNEISHISALDHIKNRSDDENEDEDENNLMHFQKDYQYQINKFDDYGIHQENDHQEDEDNQQSESAVSNSEIKSIQNQQINPFIKKGNNQLSSNYLKQNSYTSNDNPCGQILGVKQIQNLKNEQNMKNNQPINQINNNDKLQQKYVTLSQSFEEPNVFVQQKSDIQKQDQQQQNQGYLDQQLLQNQHLQKNQIGQKLQRNLFIQESAQQDEEEIQNNQIESRERQFTSKFEGKTDNSQSESFVSNESNLYNQYQYQENQKIYQNSDQGQKNSTSGINYSQHQQSISSMSSANLPNNKNNFRDQQRYDKEIERERFVDMIEEIISHKDTKNFLIKYFASNVSYVEKDIYFVYFLESLSNEYGELIEFSEDIDKIQFEEILQNKLTTNDAERISLNALQIFTKDGGLREKVQNIAQTIRSDQKQREKENINQKIVQEINQLSKILEQKSKEVSKKEKQLIERERDLKQKEQNFKSILQGELDVMLFSLDEAIKERNLEVNKRAIQLEKTLKSKMKIIESKAKEIKQQTANSSNNSDKLKSKIIATEKQGEFLKMKAQDLEKKFVIEQEKNITIQQKHDNLLRKNKELEKYVKELQNNMQQILQQRQFQNLGQDINVQLSYSDTGEYINNQKSKEKKQL